MTRNTTPETVRSVAHELVLADLDEDRAGADAAFLALDDDRHDLQLDDVMRLLRTTTHYAAVLVGVAAEHWHLTPQAVLDALALVDSESPGQDG